MEITDGYGFQLDLKENIVRHPVWAAVPKDTDIQNLSKSFVEKQLEGDIQGGNVIISEPGNSDYQIS